MRINGFNYTFDEVTQVNRPTLYPGENTHDWEIPEVFSDTFTKLNSIIENKYSKEYLKICAFYNKMFPSLKFSDWAQVSYNASPFTWMDQERSDTGTGISNNYLKQITDQLTSRLGTVQFVPYLMSEDQNFEYIVYKDEVERILRMYINKDKFNRKCIDVFHDSAVLGYSHVFIDPYTGKLVKANDYEIGLFESQMTKGKITQALYRDYAFPAADCYTYLTDDDNTADPRIDLEEITEHLKNKVTVDFCMFFDCIERKCVVSIDGKFLPTKVYPFDEVLIATMRWDTGFTAVTSSSLFDLLYPMQREINKINAKEQQLIRNYKGATPVFNNDVEIAMKSITNGTGECLYVDSQRPIDSLMTVINPTPLDPELSATIERYKSTMYELAGIQNASFDMENMRSAAAVVALDQTRDSVFQAQLSGLADFISDALKLYIYYNAGYKIDNDNMDWDSVKELIDTAYINLKPVHINNPLSDEEQAKQEPIDYIQLSTARCVLKIISGKMTFETLPYFIDWKQITLMCAATMVKFEALGIDIPDSMHLFMISAFVQDIKEGNVEL
jgi:hypothetical protein